MADQKSLGVIGFLMGGVTAAVMAIGLIVVQGHVEGRFTLDGAASPVVSMALPTVLR